MKNIRIYTALMFMALLTSTAFAQVISPVDFMRNNPRSVYANPAFYTSDFGYFDLGLGGINFGIQNIGLKYDKFFRFNNVGQPVTVDLDQGVASMRDVNYLNSFMNFDIFSSGRRTSHGYFTYTHRLRELQTMSYNKDLVQLLANGNGDFLGESNPADIGIGLSARIYQEFAVGYQMSLLEELNIGLRLKFLMGFINAQSNSVGLKLYTDPETYALSLWGMADMNATLPYQFVMEDGKPKIVDKRFNIANLFKNYGFGVDLGAEYMINEQFGVAAAINDLGSIKWNNFAVNFAGGLQDGGSFYHDGMFVFSGLTSEQLNGYLEDPEYAAQLVDSLMNYFGYDINNLTKYTTSLNANMMVRGYFNLNPENRFSAQLMGYNMGLGMKPALTLAYTGSFSGKYDVVATYTMMQGSFDNIGVGLSANLGGMLIYVASNNILGFFNPANTSQLNIQLGLSFTSGDKWDRSETIVIKKIQQIEEEEGSED